ncbi:MAG: rod shape-determining protein MreD [Balneolaceae bacterium]
MIFTENIRHFFLGLGFLAIQIILLRHLKIYGAEADLVLVYLLWLCTQKSRTEVLLFAALFGLMQDAMTDLWGLNMFSKTLLIFLVHNYLRKVSEHRFILWQIFILLLAAALIHNALIILLSLFSELYNSGTALLPILIGGSVYTALAGSFIYLVRTE